MRVAAAFIEALSRLRYTYFRFHDTVAGKFVIPHVLSLEPCSIDTALSRLNPLDSILRNSTAAIAWPCPISSGCGRRFRKRVSESAKGVP